MAGTLEEAIMSLRNHPVSDCAVIAQTSVRNRQSVPKEKVLAQKVRNHTFSHCAPMAQLRKRSRFAEASWRTASTVHNHVSRPGD
jgi:transposase